MCNGNKKCAKCAASADGAPAYNPKEITGWINKHIYNGRATMDELKHAYTPTMVWLESKKLSFTGESIADNKDEIKVAINDPNYLSDKSEERLGWRIALLFVIAGILIYFLFKDTPGTSSAAPIISAPPVPIPVPAPAPAPVVATPAPAPAVLTPA
jgi:hypothetical protein